MLIHVVSEYVTKMRPLSRVISVSSERQADAGEGTLLKKFHQPNLPLPLAGEGWGEGARRAEGRGTAFLSISFLFIFFISFVLFCLVLFSFVFILA